MKMDEHGVRVHGCPVGRPCSEDRCCHPLPVTVRWAPPEVGPRARTSKPRTKHLRKICSEEHRCVDFLEDAESWSIESR